MMAPMVRPERAPAATLDKAARSEGQPLGRRKSPGGGLEVVGQCLERRLPEEAEGAEAEKEGATHPQPDAIVLVPGGLGHNPHGDGRQPRGDEDGAHGQSRGASLRRKGRK